MNTDNLQLLKNASLQISEFRILQVLFGLLSAAALCRWK